MPQITDMPELPELDQNEFPALPMLIGDKVLLIMGSSWQNAEREWVAGILITACVRAQKWQPIQPSTFLNVMMDGRLEHASRDITNAMWQFVEEKLLSVIAVGEQQYVVMTPEFVRIALDSRNHLRSI